MNAVAGRVPNMLGSYRPFASLLFAGLLLALPGCVALNIPANAGTIPKIKVACLAIIKADLTIKPAVENACEPRIRR